MHDATQSAIDEYCAFVVVQAAWIVAQYVGQSATEGSGGAFPAHAAAIMQARMVRLMVAMLSRSRRVARTE
jgi:hypothetical protein